MEALEVDGEGSDSVPWHLVFTLNSKKYVLHVNSNGNTVTAIEVSYEFDCFPCMRHFDWSLKIGKLF